jgi:hypothetical protein
LCFGWSCLIGREQATQISTADIAKHLSQESLENGKGIANWPKTAKSSGK